MKTLARIEGGRLAEILETDFEIDQLYDPPSWVDITGVVPQPAWGWLWDGFVFTEPPPPYIDPRPAIMAELEQIDRASARPLRILIIAEPDVGLGTPERAELEALELRAADLRAQLEALPPPP